MLNKSGDYKQVIFNYFITTGKSPDAGLIKGMKQKLFKSNIFLESQREFYGAAWKKRRGGEMKV